MRAPVDGVARETSATASAPSVVVPTLGPARLERLLDSLADQTLAHQTIVVDNGSADGEVARLCTRYEDVEALRLERNAGYSRACNLGAARADGDAVVLLNDDCVCDPEFVERIVEPLDPVAGTVMAAGVMRDWNDPDRIDSAGMELDRTLLVFDYLNGEPLSRLDGRVEDPIGPSGAAAAFDRATFLAVRGFDERLFAYWEDVDLVLRLRRLGFRCALAAGARGVHEHSATLGSGSARKNYLMGFGRGYVLRKWRVLSAGRAAPLITREAALCIGQLLVDRNAAGIKGRLRGYRATEPTEPYPSVIEGADSAPGAVATLRRRAVRRARLRSRRREDAGRKAPREKAPAPVRTLAVFHVAEPGGPLLSLGAELEWLAGLGELQLLVPGEGELAPSLVGAGRTHRRDYSALTVPTSGLDAIAAIRQLSREVRGFRAEIRDSRPDLVLVVSATLPAVLLAARSEGVPTVVYAGEVLSGGELRGLQRRLAGRLVVGMTRRLAHAVIACSRTVAAQYEGGGAPVTVVLPPLRGEYVGGDREAFRRRHGIGESDLLIAAVGNITGQRGQDVLVQALAEVRRTHPTARCVIAGEVLPRPRDAAFREQLEHLVDRLGLSEAVVFAGFVDPVADVYAAADIVVNPTRYESFGRVAFEAALAGRPVVSTSAGAIPEVLSDGESALLVEPDCPEALAGAIVRLLDEPELAVRLVAGGRRFAREQLSGERALTAFRSVVASVLGRDPQAGAPGPSVPPARPRAAQRRARRRRGPGHA